MKQNRDVALPLIGVEINIISCRRRSRGASATNKTSQLFSVRESSTFCLKAIITVVSHEYRHEFGAAYISPPTSRPSSSPRRGRSASASSPATDYVNLNPNQWEGNVSVLLQIFIVRLRIVQNQEYTCYFTSQRAPEMVPTRPATPEMVPRPAAVGEPVRKYHVY